MARFQQKGKSNRSIGILCGILFFIVVLLLFTTGVSSLSRNTIRRQRTALENALNRDITYCYTTEGTYPESLEYLRENYGLTYDEELFYVDYQTSGSNIYPDVTIIEKGDSHAF